MHSVVLLNVAVCKGASVLEKLLPCEDETLLVGWDTLLDLDLLLGVLDCVIGGNIQGKCPPSQGLDDDLHPLYKVYGCGVKEMKQNQKEKK